MDVYGNQENALEDNGFVNSILFYGSSKLSAEYYVKLLKRT
jgi:hypothetical protein